MTMRQWSIVAILVFFNAFIFTTLFIFIRQVYLTPPEVAVATSTPTRTPTFTPLPTDTPTPLLTPSPTNTLVIPPATPTPTFTPTFTPAPPTPTFTPVPPTPTSLPPTATPVPPTPTITPTFTPTAIPTPTATPTPSYEFMYEQGSMQVAPNCGTVYIEGIVLDRDGGALDGVTVRLQFFDITDYRVSGDGKPPGEWGFAPLAMDMYHTPVTFYLQLVNSKSDATPRSNVVTIDFTGCDAAGQFTNIRFKRQY